ncbi:hypothetical protein H3Z83_05690 [Tenacibaculum sp. S7007]|uniref:Uncharacterized protein n=1 Tax=Tenacibaculum pelagium TaxID=2759527 RepID=A0A839ANR5_9FLAO|nr:hypothetical protein [Tenacibaculum pelagium]MBA6156010.1 hypothetical protein [Tenacibaculum pelagium]
MKTIIKDWLEFCEVDRITRRGLYNTLFMDNISEKEVNTIFEPFKNKKELSFRMNRYLNDWRKGGIIDNTDNKNIQMRDFLKSDFEERKVDIENVSFFNDIVFPTNYEYNDSYDEVHKMVMSDEFSQEFNDYFREKKINENPKTYELYRAISYISKHYSYTQYLFQPLVNMNYTANHIYEFLIRGGVYAVIDDTVFYSFKK